LEISISPIVEAALPLPSDDILWIDPIDDRRERGPDGEDVPVIEGSFWGCCKEIDEVCRFGILAADTIRFPRLWRTKYRALAFHLAVARAHIFCFVLISFSTSVLSPFSGAGFLCRRLTFISTSLSLNFRRLSFRQKTHPIMTKHMQKASTNDNARISAERLW
jgi:hypothetical protein